MSDDRIGYGRDLRRTRKRCGFDCARLQVPSLIDELSQHTAANLIRAGFHAFSYPNHSKEINDENDDLTEGDRSRGQGETTRDEVTSGVSALQCRTQQLVGTN